MLFLFGICAALGLGALSLVNASSTRAAVVLGGFGIASVGLSWSLGYLSLDEVSQRLRYGLMRQQRLRGHLKAVQEAALAIRGSSTVQQALQVVEVLAAQVDADSVSCSVSVTKGGELAEHRLMWPVEDGVETEARSGMLLVFPLDSDFGAIQTEGALSFHWNTSATMLQIPEAASYDWIALVLRDQVVKLARADGDP